jgi:hypothetical protein
MRGSLIAGVFGCGNEDAGLSMEIERGDVSAAAKQHFGGTRVMLNQQKVRARTCGAQNHGLRRTGTSEQVCRGDTDFGIPKSVDAENSFSGLKTRLDGSKATC